MAPYREFQKATAVRAVAADQAEVEFINRNQMAYRVGDQSLDLTHESYIDERGLHDGCVVDIPDELNWNDGLPVTSVQRDQLLQDLRAASIALNTRIRVNDEGGR